MWVDLTYHYSPRYRASPLNAPIGCHRGSDGLCRPCNGFRLNVLYSGAHKAPTRNNIWLHLPEEPKARTLLDALREYGDPRTYYVNSLGFHRVQDGNGGNQNKWINIDVDNSYQRLVKVCMYTVSV